MPLPAVSSRVFLQVQLSQRGLSRHGKPSFPGCLIPPLLIRLSSFVVSPTECNVLGELSTMREVCLAQTEDFLDCALDLDTSMALESFFVTDTEI